MAAHVRPPGVAGECGSNDRAQSSLAPLLLVGAILVGFGADDGEAGVEIDLDDAAIVQLDLDAVGRAVVADFGLDDGAAAGVRQSRLGGPVQVGADQRCVGVRVFTAAIGHDDPCARADGDECHKDGDHIGFLVSLRCASCGWLLDAHAARGSMRGL